MRVVIFTQRVEVVESYAERRDCTDQRVSGFLRACGYLALPIPNSTDGLGELLDKVRPVGIVLTGGNSLVKYGGNALERDATDSMLIELAEAKRIPLYGFCRGMQSILDHYGNRLVEVQGHVAVRHIVNGKNGVSEVNSYHSQACMELENRCGLKVLAKAEDGVIEAVGHDSLPIVATMWHPEREKKFVEEDIERVKRLFG